MPNVRLKGLNRVRKKLKDGSFVVYWYAWKGGPRLEGKPGSAEFIGSFNRAVADRRGPKKDTLKLLVVRYRGSPEWAKYSASTKAEWSRWLDKISADETRLDIGGIPVAALNDRRILGDLLAWRDQWADRPRSADYAIQVLSRVLSWNVGRGHLSLNVTKGIEQLYASDRAEQVWTAADIEAFVKAAPSPEVGFIMRLACLTGLRREDLLTLCWTHVSDIAIEKPTLKSGERKIAVIPLLAETEALLTEIKTQQTVRQGELAALAGRKGRPSPPGCITVLSSTRGRPWSVDGAEHQVIATKTKAGVDKHLHDARGTFGTRLRRAGLTAPEIADILGWEEERVERLMAKYVDREAIIRGIAERVRENESRAKTPN